MQKFGILLLVTGLIISGLLIREQLQFQTSAPTERLETLWTNDLGLLTRSHKLPEGWSQIGEIKLVPGTDEAKKLIKDLHSPISLKKGGANRLELLILTWVEGDVYGAVVQHSLIDIASNNLIWELGRTYVLHGDPDLKKLNLKLPGDSPLVSTQKSGPVQESEVKSPKPTNSIKSSK